MTHNPERSRHVTDTVEWLELLQKNGINVMIELSDDLDFGAKTFYWGSIDQIVKDAQPPHLRLLARKAVVKFFTEKDKQASSLFEALREACEAVSLSESAPEALAEDLNLASLVDREIGVDPDEHEVDFGDGKIQIIAIESIRSAMGVQYND